MSWAASRSTTRPEDMAYALLGLFDINMPLLYGEGGERAFMRLQEEIIKRHGDHTLFLWSAPFQVQSIGLLSDSPERFCGMYTYVPGSTSSQFVDYSILSGEGDMAIHRYPNIIPESYPPPPDFTHSGVRLSVPLFSVRDAPVQFSRDTTHVAIVMPVPPHGFIGIDLKLLGGFKNEFFKNSNTYCYLSEELLSHIEKAIQWQEIVVQQGATSSQSELAYNQDVDRYSKALVLELENNVALVENHLSEPMLDMQDSLNTSHGQLTALNNRIVTWAWGRMSVYLLFRHVSGSKELDIGVRVSNYEGLKFSLTVALTEERRAVDFAASCKFHVPTANTSELLVTASGRRIDIRICPLGPRSDDRFGLHDFPEDGHISRYRLMIHEIDLDFEGPTSTESGASWFLEEMRGEVP